MSTSIFERAQAIVSDSERVTQAHLRKVSLPGATIGLITLDNGEDHTKPNTLGPRSLTEYNHALNAALARDDVAAIAITGKPFILAAGADLKALGGLTGRDQAIDIARIGHAVFDKLRTSPVPTFAFINGLALGGGLEISLHAQYRTVSRAAAGIALREMASPQSMCLLEPIDTVTVTVDDEYLGAVMTDIGTRRGQIIGSAPADGEPGRSVLEAAVPQLELLDYAISLRSLAHGTGSFHREHRGYEQLPERLVSEHLGETRRA